MKKLIIHSIFFALGLLFVGCTKDNTNKPTSDFLMVSGVIEVVDTDGHVITTDLRSDTSTEKGTITGLGTFPSGTLAKIRIKVNEGYTYKGMYFRHNTTYPLSQFPTSASTAIRSRGKNFNVIGDITVVAVIEQNNSAIVDIEP